MLLNESSLFTCLVPVFRWMAAGFVCYGLWCWSVTWGSFRFPHQLNSCPLNAAALQYTESFAIHTESSSKNFQVFSPFPLLVLWSSISFCFDAIFPHDQVLVELFSYILDHSFLRRFPAKHVLVICVYCYMIHLYLPITPKFSATVHRRGWLHLLSWKQRIWPKILANLYRHLRLALKELVVSSKFHLPFQYLLHHNHGEVNFVTQKAENGKALKQTLSARHFD